MKKRALICWVKNRSLLILLLGISFTYANYFVNRNNLDRNWDRAMYHDYIARGFQHGWLIKDWQAAGLNTWLSAFAEWPLMVFEHVLKPNIADKVLGVVCAVGTTLIVWMLAKEIFPRNEDIEYVFGATLLSIASPFFLAELGTTFQNWSTTPLVLAGIQQLLKARRKRGNHHEIVAGVLLGIAVSLKVNNYIFLVAVLLTFLFSILLNFDSIREFKKTFVRFTLGSLFGLTPFLLWSFYVYSKMKNPIFPFFNAFFRSPYYANENFRDLRWKADGIQTVWSFLTGWHKGSAFSELQSFEPSIFLFTWFLLFVVLLHTTTLRKFQIKPKRESITNDQYFLIWFCLSLSAWTFVFFYARYLEPIEVSAGIAFSILVKVIASRSKNMKASSRSILSLGIAIAFSFLVVPNWTQASALNAFAENSSRWGSPVTTAVSKSSGILLTAGNPTSFLRLSSPKVDHMIRTDFGPIPDNFKHMIVTAYESGDNISYVRAGSLFDSTQINAEIANSTGLKISFDWICVTLQGPIAVPYEVCQLH